MNHKSNKVWMLSYTYSKEVYNHNNSNNKYKTNGNDIILIKKTSAQYNIIFTIIKRFFYIYTSVDGVKTHPWTCN